MADTSFVDNSTSLANRVVAAWLNAVNKWAYWGRRPNYGITTGSANSQILTLEIGSLYVVGTETDGDEFTFKAGFTNTGSLILQVKPAGAINTAVAVQLNQQALVGGEVTAGSIYKVQRLGATWQLFNFQQAVDGRPIVTGSIDPTKKLRLSVSGMTTGITGVLAAAFTTAKTVTLPDATDTLVGLATTDTLTNKTLTSPVVTNLASSGTLTHNGLLDLSGASGGQVKFPSTPNPSSNVNTLDDYKEGTWTPTGIGSTFTSATGNYVKIGNRVFFDFDITWPATGAGNQTGFNGLPFVIGGLSSAAIGLTGYATAFTIALVSATSGCLFYKFGSAAVLESDLSTLRVLGSGHYRI